MASLLAKLLLLCAVCGAAKTSVLEFQDNGGTCTISKNGNKLAISSNCALEDSSMEARFSALEARVTALESWKGSQPTKVTIITGTPVSTGR